MNDFNNYRGSILNQNGDLYFRNAGNKMFIVYMPENITEEQVYKLELNDYVINDFEYLGVVKQYQRFEFTENIWENFSSEVIQPYFRKNNL